ncbi:hypothetical protein [Halococcus salifodinae]|uniref:hypothetical protein n=1 Tax=Halococcus salifodinae TaxID=36738 RepID=UPI003F87645F
MEESLPVGGLLFAWYVLSALVAALANGSFLGTLSIGFQIVGSATAVVFVVVRGIAIARETRPLRLSGDLRELLDESTVVAVPVLVWVALGTLVALPFGLFRFGTSVPTLVAAFVQTAIATTGLYVVVRVVPVLRSGVGSGRTAALGDDCRVRWRCGLRAWRMKGEARERGRRPSEQRTPEHASRAPSSRSLRSRERRERAARASAVLCGAVAVLGGSRARPASRAEGSDGAVRLRKGVATVPRVSGANERQFLVQIFTRSGPRSESAKPTSEETRRGSKDAGGVFRHAETAEPSRNKVKRWVSSSYRRQF